MSKQIGPYETLDEMSTALKTVKQFAPKAKFAYLLVVKEVADKEDSTKSNGLAVARAARTFLCAQCSRRFPTAQGRSMHVARAHTGKYQKKEAAKEQTTS